MASYVKHQGDGATGVQVLGPIHGILFVAFVGLALVLRREALEQRDYGTRTLGAVVPFGGYVVDWWLLNEHRPRVAACGDRTTSQPDQLGPTA